MKKRFVGVLAGFALLAQWAALTPVRPNLQLITIAEAKRPDVRSQKPRNADRRKIGETLAKLPLRFEENRGQAAREAKFVSRGPNYALLLTRSEAVLSLMTVKEDSASKITDRHQRQSAVLRMKLIGGNNEPEIRGAEPLQGKSNYLIGNDRKKWHTDIPTFGRVLYQDVYPGIDLIYYGNQQRLEYDFNVAPGADPAAIRLSFDGADEIKVDADGALRMKIMNNEVVQPAPVIYQQLAGRKQTIAGRYVINGKGEVTFAIDQYDRSVELVIDPQIVYSTFYGGSATDVVTGIAVDANGNTYLGGRSSSTDLLLKNAFQGQYLGDSANNAFLVKMNAAGNDIIYATYFGDSDGSVGINAIAVTSDGKACVTGVLGNAGSNSDFPTTPGRFQGNGSNFLDIRGIDSYLTVFQPAGNALSYSTFYGANGVEEAFGIAVDAANMVYITGASNASNLPNKNAFQAHNGTTSGPNADDAFIAKFNPAASGNDSLIYSSYLGGSGGETGRAIAVTSAGVAFVAGVTGSFNYPIKSSSSLPPFQTAQGGVNDGFVAKISSSGALIYSTFFGGNGADSINAIAVDSAERAYVTGKTVSNAATFPLKNAFDSLREGGTDAFVAKFNADGTTLFYSSFLGGSANDSGEGIAIDLGGNAYIAGSYGSLQGFPVVNGFPSTVANGTTFIAKIEASDAAGTTTPRVLYSDTFLGDGTSSQSLALDSRGNLYISGAGNATFPTTPGAFQENFKGQLDGFVTKVASTFPDSIGVFRPSTGEFLFRNSNSSGRAELITTFGQPGDQALAGDWDGNGIDDPGVFRPSTGQFLLRQPTLFFGVVINAVRTINFGLTGDKAVVGDWNGDGIDTPGVFRNGQWLLTNAPNTNNSTPAADLIFNFGAAADTPIAGDWDGDGIDTIGTFNQGVWSLRNSNSAGAANITALSGSAAGNRPVVGDWNGDGIDTIGVFVPSNVFGFTAFALLNQNATSNGFDIVADFGVDGDLPVSGDWDGKPGNTPPNSGINNPSDGSINSGQTQVFTTTCSDPDGWHDIQKIDFKIAQNSKAGSAGDDSVYDAPGNGDDGKGSGDGAPLILWVQFDENRNVIRFYDPDLQTWSEAAAGSNIVLESRFARLFLSGTAVQGSGPLGPSVQVTWKITFKEAAKGSHRQFLRITDDAGASTGFDRVGSWKVKK